jgi:two-component sensor histidine kinase
LQEKEVLLREVHHRVKNNLQVICSMLRLQERNIRDDTLLQVLRDCRARVHAMAMLHDQLHRAKDFSNINLGEYIRNLAASLFSSYGVNSADVSLRLDIEDIPVAVDTAIPCGLIVNELVSNSLRHAFPEGRTGHVSLDLHARPGGCIELAISDDGRGFPESANPTDTRSLGLWLVDLLAGQIGASVERSSIGGAQYRLVFVGQAISPANQLTNSKEKSNA